MSTRANIIIKDEYSKLWFYRHSDGYPEGTMPTLNKFMQLVIDGKIRANASQAAGWLIIIGAEEYKQYHIKSKDRKSYMDMSKGQQRYWKNKISSAPRDWKVGAYEPTTGQHGDIEYLYTVNLTTKKITYKRI